MTAARGTPSLPERIAGRIHREVARGRTDTLPSATRLARRYRVSRTTVLRACDLLRRRGVLEFSRGRRMHVVRDGQATDPAPEPSSRERLYRDLREGITTGRLRVGARLPKAAYYARTYHAAERTVRGVYRRLIAEKLLHQAGRMWVVGPPPIPHPSFSMTRTPVIAVVLRHIWDWRSLAYSERTRDFCAAFSNECTRHRVRLAPFPVSEGRNRERMTRRGAMSIRDEVEKQGGWHIGTLVVWPRTMVPGLSPLLEALLQPGKPVVWLDHSDHPRPPRIRHPAFIRCRFSERQGLLRVLEMLAELGHSRIGYLGRTGRNGWEVKRYRGCVALARRRWPHMTIDRCAAAEGEFGLREKPVSWPAAEEGYIDWFGSSGGISETERAALDRGDLTSPLISHGRQFEDLLAFHPGITAVVTSNQYRARELYSYLHWKGVRVPEDISLITFDNYLQFQIWPLTTVDFGFGNLGYRAFHAIRGDLPVRIGADRTMLTEASVINRGSLDRPRSHALPLPQATPDRHPHRPPLM